MILVGHSIGGMLNLEYARRFPHKLGRDVKALVQVNTTFTNPIEMKKGAELSRKLQKPVLEPRLRVVDWLSPVARAVGWFAYRSGLAHLQLAMQSFAGEEDTTTLPSASDRMERDIRASTQVSVSRAAHLGPVERYRAYADAIAAFAARTAPE